MSNDNKNGRGMDLGLEDDYAGFFTPLENDTPYLKIAFEGEAGSGKTFTMVRLAIALHKRIGSTKPIVYVDTEKAAKHFKHEFAAAGVKILHKPSRSMADLQTAMRLLREGVGDILLMDSGTHIWQAFVKAYLLKHKKTRLELNDWGLLKPLWQELFTDPFVNDPYHCMMTGRVGFEYDSEIDEETKKRQIFKTRIKMKMEGETAYEPDLLVLMERMEDVLDKHSKDVWRQATVLKDRSNVIDGKVFRNPTADNFMPAIEMCLTDPVSRARPIEGDAGILFATEEDKRAWFRARDILVEDIENILVENWPGQSADDKKAKILALKAGFQTASWTWIKNQKPELLADGKARIEEHVAVGKSQAAAALAAQGPAAEVDATPKKATNGKKRLTVVDGKGDPLVPESEAK